MCLLFVYDWCLTASAHSFQWQSSGSVKPVVPTNDCWHFPIPSLLGVGQHLRQQFNFKSRRRPAKQLQNNPGQSSYLPLPAVVLTQLFQSLVVLCDRLMYFSGRSAEAVQSDPSYVNNLAPTPDGIVPCAELIITNALIPDQSGFANWTPAMVSFSADTEGYATTAVENYNQDPARGLLSLTEEQTQ